MKKETIQSSKVGKSQNQLFSQRYESIPMPLNLVKHKQYENQYSGQY